MGLHIQSNALRKPLRLGGFRVVVLEEYIEVYGGPFCVPWPILARKLDGQGWLVRVLKANGKVSLQVSCSSDDLRALILGRRKRSRFPKPISIASVITVLTVAAMIPIGANRVDRRPSSLKNVASPCTSEGITSWLQESQSLAEARVLEASEIGGVTAGTLECKGSRYSYTLRSEEPKRVLKLLKLDS